VRQAVLEKAGKFRLAEVPRPAPAAGEVLLRVKAVGICGSDLHLFREGRIGDVPIELAGSRSEGKFIPGHECMGVVEEVGSGVDAALAGRRVAVDPMAACGHCELCLAGNQNLCPNMVFLGHPPVGGCLREHLVLRADQVVPLPDELDDDAAVVLEPLGVALHALRIGKVGPARSAAVLGSGPVGLSCIMLLARMGVSPLIATDVLDYRLALAGELGATHALNPARTDIASEVKALTGGRGADCVLECAGAPQTAGQTAEVAAIGGRVLVLGIPASDQDTLAFRHSAARRKGLTVFMIRRANRTTRDGIAWALKDRLPLGRLVTHHWPLAKVQEAFETVAGYADGVVKAIVNPQAGA
jgi:L-iditol 2-dehydrogenase